MTRSFTLLAGFLLSLLFVIAIPSPTGGADFDEYAAMAVAFAEHGTPEIRVADLQRAKTLFPEQAPKFEAASTGIAAGASEAKPGIVRGRDGNYYAIHFPAYSALVALPLKAFVTLGGPAFKAFQLVNAAFILALGLSLRRVLGSWERSLSAVALFLLCGGVLYCKWGSPECMTAASLLASVALFVGGAPLRAGLLAGLAGMQNPALIGYVVFAPLLRLTAHYDSRLPLRANLQQALAPSYLAGVALTASLMALPVLVNLYQFGIASKIGAVAADIRLMSMVRFSSLFLDPNQGMIIAIPGVVGGLVYCWARPDSERTRSLMFLAVIAAFTVALALPTVTTTNWNSGSAGVMRYAFWLAMPILFALIWRLDRMQRVSTVFAVSLATVQIAAVFAMFQNRHYLQFHPAAHWLLRNYPQLYNPEPELFAERLMHKDDGLDTSKVYVYEWQGQTQKILYHRSNWAFVEKYCGPGRVLRSTSTPSDRGWRYLTGTPVCGDGLNVDDFLSGTTVKLGQGWSHPEKNGGQWDGVWSDGSKSSVALLPPHGIQPSHLRLFGQYFGDNKLTRIVINGHDYGWRDLSVGASFDLPVSDASAIQIELEHARPSSPPSDPRQVAFFLRQISLY